MQVSEATSQRGEGGATPLGADSHPNRDHRVLPVATAAVFLVASACLVQVVSRDDAQVAARAFVAWMAAFGLLGLALARTINHR